MQRISVQNLSKSYTVGHKGSQSVLDIVVSLFTGREHKKPLLVLDNVSFSVQAGEIVGIVGKNGSGKSTLLRILVDILEKDSGEVHLSGKVVPLIQLGDGMKTRLTLKDNIYLACTLLGFSQREIVEKFDAIVAYAELENFVYTKWYQFSLGMKQRAVFSIIIHTEPEILLLDEVFSAGDESFRKKTLTDMLKFAHAGTSILMVGHGLEILEKYCDRIIWIDAGKVRADGKPTEIINMYKEHVT